MRFEKHGRRFLACRGCGLVRIDPMPAAASLAAYYSDQYADGRYAAFAGAAEVRRAIARHRLTKVLEATGHVGEARGAWLDVGCSTGDFLAEAGAEGIDIEGIDVSPGAALQARERGLRARSSKVEDFEPDRRFDAITAFDLLEHVLDPRAVVARLREWLAPGGTLVLTLPDVRSLYPRLLMRRHWFYYWPDEHLWYFDPKTIRRLLSEEGFTVEPARRAFKPITLDYAAENLASFSKRLGRVARALVAVIPRGLRDRPLPLYLGEMMVVAHRGAGEPGAAAGAYDPDVQRAYFGRAEIERYRWITSAPGLAETEDELLSAATAYVREPGLEIGCGEGNNLLRLARGRRFTGVDLFREKLLFARGEQPDLRFAAADGSALPFADASFESVFVRDLLHHVEDPRRVLAEASRVLRPGGSLCLLEPNGRNPLIWLQTRAIRAEAGARSFSPAHVAGLFAGLPLADLSIETRQPLPLRRTVLHYRFGVPALGRVPVLRGLLAAAERVLGALVPRSRWTYVFATAHRREASYIAASRES